MGNVKQINIKNRTYYSFNDTINIKDFDSSLIKIDKNVLQKHWHLQHWIHYNKKIDDYENINSVNPLYLIIGKADRYIEENNGKKYLVFTSTDGNKIVLAKFAKLWDETQHPLNKY